MTGSKHREAFVAAVAEFGMSAEQAGALADSVVGMLADATAESDARRAEAMSRSVERHFAARPVIITADGREIARTVIQALS